MVTDTVLLWQRDPDTKEWYTIPLADTLVYLTQRPGGRNDVATYYLRRTLETFGLDTVLVDTHSTRPEVLNVIGVKEGVVDPDRLYVLSAHYDGRPDIPAADDNASGTAAVIEAARILANVETRYTILFALFDTEEFGLLGSRDFAQRMLDAGEDIAGVINLDMIAWDGDDDHEFEIHPDFASSFLANEIVKITKEAGLDLIPRLEYPGVRASDHYAFWERGYPGVLLIEENRGGDFNPYYHQPGDTLGNFNLAYFHEMSKLALAVAASYAADSSFVPIVHIHAKALLEGAYVAGDSMEVAAPFDAGRPTSQPFAEPFFDGTPLEYDSVVTVAAFPDSTIDWVLVDLRSDSTAGSYVEGSRRVGLLMKHGTVADTNGMMLGFPAIEPGPYRLVVRHRNHLPVMSSDTTDTSDALGSWDFTRALSSAHSLGSAPMRDFGNGYVGLFAGEAGTDGVVTTLDFNSWLAAAKSVLTGYRQEDFNLDAAITTLDFNYWLVNTKAVASGQVPD
jgi:hypothetical protein